MIQNCSIRCQSTRIVNPIGRSQPMHDAELAVEQIRHLGRDNLQATRDKQVQMKAHLG